MLADTYHTRGINLRHLGLALLVSAVLTLGTTNPACAQEYASQQGRLLDANNRLGSFGFNSNVSFNALNTRINSYVTGNVTGGARFQGLVPYRSGGELNVDLGSGLLSDFRRDSVGQRQLSNTLNAPRTYVDPSRAVTRNYGTRIISSSKAFQTPDGSVQGGREYGAFGQRSPGGNSLSVRPLTRSYSTLKMKNPYGITPAAQGATPLAGDRDTIVQPRRSPLVDPPTRRSSEQTDGSLTLRSAAADPGLVARPEPERGRHASVAASPFGKALATYADRRLLSRSAKLSDDRRPATLSRDIRSEDRYSGPVDSSSPPAEPSAAPAMPATPSGVATTDHSAEFGEPAELIQQTDFPAQSAAPGAAPVAASPTIADIRAAYAKRSAARFTEYLNNGVQYMRNGEYYRAANEFEKAAIFDSNPVADLAKACALFAAGEFMSSAYYLDKAITVAPELAAARLDLAALFSDADALQKSFADLNRWQQRSHQPMLTFLKGYIQYQSGSIGSARISLDEALTALPGTPAIQAVLTALDTQGKDSQPAAPDQSSGPGRSSPAKPSTALDALTKPREN